MVDAHTEDYGWDAAPPESAGYINAAVRQVLRGLAPRDVLDAGCGNGALAKDLVEDGYRVVGIDADAGGVAHARRTVPGARFEVATFDRDPRAFAPDGGFDAVVSTEVVEHLYAPHELAAFCFAALRPGGHVVISTPYHGYAKNLALAVFDKWDKHHTVDWHGGHIKFWSRRTLGALLEEAGFRVTGFVGAGRLPYLWKSMVLVAERPR